MAHIADLATAPVSEKLRAPLRLAGKVQHSGRLVTKADAEQARQAGADERAIHDAVLIAAAFCMFNRCVDGLATQGYGGSQGVTASNARTTTAVVRRTTSETGGYTISRILPFEWRLLSNPQSLTALSS